MHTKPNGFGRFGIGLVGLVKGLTHEFVYIARQHVYTQINYRTRIDYVGMWNIITFCYPLGVTKH